MQQFLTVLLFLFSISLSAQVGEIQGIVKDIEMNGEGQPFANVYVEMDGIPRDTTTDMDGFYNIKPLAPSVLGEF